MYKHLEKDIMVIGTSYMNQELSGNNRSNYIPSFLQKNGYNVERITTNFNHHTKSFVFIVEEKLPYKATILKTISYKNNISFRRVLSQYIYGRNLKKYLKNRKKPDTIYLFVPSISAANIIRKYAKKNKINLIIDVRDLWPEAFQMVFNVPVISDLFFSPFKVRANKVYRSADSIIAVSDTYRDRALKANKKTKEAHTIYLGTDLNVIDPIISEVNRDIDSNTLSLAYVGTLGRSYDLETVFKSIEILENKGYDFIKLKIMGNGPLEEKFKNEAKKLKSSVNFMGRLSYGDMIKELYDCDIALNPIKKGSAGSIINKHADYAAVGLPVINSQESEEYRQIVENYKVGLNSRNEDPHDMANKIEILIKNKELRLLMGKNHREFAEKYFDREETHKKILELM